MERSVMFEVHSPEQRGKENFFERTYWVYRIHAYNLDTLPQYERPEAEFFRRYSDFEWLYKILSAQYPHAIVPPIPEKDMSVPMDTILKVNDQPVLEYRRRAFRRFLQRVMAHRELRESPHLKDFILLSENEFVNRVKDTPIEPRPNLLEAIGSTVSTLAEQINQDVIGSQQADQYVRILRRQEFSIKNWKDASAYIDRLSSTFGALRERFSILVKRRRDIGQSVAKFSESFNKVAEAERTLEQQADGSFQSLSNALASVSEHSSSVCQSYLSQADRESESIVEVFTYYILLCNSVKEMIARVVSRIKELEQADAEVAKVQSEKEKCQKAELARDLDIKLQGKKEHQKNLAEGVKKLQAAAHEELKRFHVEKQYDLKKILQDYASIQTEYANKMRQTWADLQPSVESVGKQ